MAGAGICGFEGCDGGGDRIFAGRFAVSVGGGVNFCAFAFFWLGYNAIARGWKALDCPGYSVTSCPLGIANEVKQSSSLIFGEIGAVASSQHDESIRMDQVLPASSQHH